MMSATPRTLDRHDQKSIGFRIPWDFAYRLDTVIAQWAANHPHESITRMAFIRRALEKAVRAAEGENQERLRETK
jgi:hypothetical protein